MYALASFHPPSPLMAGDEHSLSGGGVVRLMRWTEHATFPMPEKADLFVPGDPPVRALYTRVGKRAVRGSRGEDLGPGSPVGAHFAFMMTGERYADEFSALTQEFWWLLMRRGPDGFAVETFEELEAHLQRRVEAMNRGIHEDRQVTLESPTYPRDRWIEDLYEDTHSEGILPTKWVRISDRALDALAELATSQSAALARGTRVPVQWSKTWGGLHEGKAQGEIVQMTRLVEKSPSAPVPVCRAMVPKGTQLLLATSDHPDAQIGKDGSVPIERVGNGHAFRTFVMFTDAYLQRPRDANGERPATFEVNIGAMLESYGLPAKGKVRTHFTEAQKTLQELMVRSVEVGPEERRERWVMTGANGEEQWEPLLTKYEKKILGRDGKEHTSGAARFRLAGAVIIALGDVSRSVQIPRESLGKEPEKLLSLVGLATVHRAHMSRVFKSPRKEYRLPNARTLVEGCFRGSVAAGNTVERQFDRLRDLAEENGYGQIMLTPSGEVIVTPNEWFLDVYASLADAKARHTKAHYAKKAKPRAK
jgi:hypothetical protein